MPNSELPAGNQLPSTAGWSVVDCFSHNNNDMVETPPRFRATSASVCLLAVALTLAVLAPTVDARKYESESLQNRTARLKGKTCASTLLTSVCPTPHEIAASLTGIDLDLDGLARKERQPNAEGKGSYPLRCNALVPRTAPESLMSRRAGTSTRVYPRQTAANAEALGAAKKQSTHNHTYVCFSLENLGTVCMIGLPALSLAGPSTMYVA